MVLPANSKVVRGTQSHPLLPQPHGKLVLVPGGVEVFLVALSGQVSQGPYCDSVRQPGPLGPCQDLVRQLGPLGPCRASVLAGRHKVRVGEAEGVSRAE